MEKNEKTNSNREDLEIERRYAAEMSEEEMAQLLRHRWEDSDFPDISFPDGDKERLYDKISSNIFNQKVIDVEAQEPDNKSRSWKRIARYAAAILVPVVMVAAFFLYDSGKTEADTMTIVRTERGERKNVTLPDGTEVNLNSASELSYNTSRFAEGKREVKFEGEALFIVASDPSHPFMVNTGEVRVKVIGTEFNVFSRKDFEDISVFLMKGKVEMLCAGVADAIELNPWQKAIFDKQDKKVELISTDSNDNDIAWLNNELAFTNEPLEDVVNKLEISYAVDFDRDAISHLSKDRFTGTVPMDDLSTVIDVLEDVYEVKFTVKDKKIEIGS